MEKVVEAIDLIRAYPIWVQIFVPFWCAILLAVLILFKPHDDPIPESIESPRAEDSLVLHRPREPQLEQKSKVLFELSAPKVTQIGTGKFDVNSDHSYNFLKSVASAYMEGNVTQYVVSELMIDAPLLSKDEKIEFRLEVEHIGVGSGNASVTDITTGFTTILERQESTTEKIELLNRRKYRVEVNAQVYASRDGEGSHSTSLSLFIDPEINKLHSNQ
ncbi:MAG: hypothetical protein ABJ308_01800 [Halieaceae bacterium]